MPFRSQKRVLAASSGVIACALLSACILDWDSLRGGVTADAGPDVPIGDSSDAEASNCKLKLLINEVQVAGSLGAADEFLELRNDADCGGSLAGYEIRYSSAGGSTPKAIWTGTTEKITAKGYAVIGGKAFQGQTNLIGRWIDDGDSGAFGALAAAGGGVGLFGPDLLLVDAVAYETLTNKNHPFLKPQGGAGAPNPPSAKSIARVPDGTNTDVNSSDFKLGTPTPGASN